MLFCIDVILYSYFSNNDVNFLSTYSIYTLSHSFILRYNKVLLNNVLYVSMVPSNNIFHKKNYRKIKKKIITLLRLNTTSRRSYQAHLDICCNKRSICIVPCLGRTLPCQFSSCCWMLCSKRMTFESFPLLLF